MGRLRPYRAAGPLGGPDAAAMRAFRFNDLQAVLNAVTYPRRPRRYQQPGARPLFCRSLCHNVSDAGYQEKVPSSSSNLIFAYYSPFGKPFLAGSPDFVATDSKRGS